MTIKITVDLPDTLGFIPESPLEIAGRIFAPLKGEAWEAAIAVFLVRWANPSTKAENPFRFAVEEALRHGASLLPTKEEQMYAEKAMITSLDRLTVTDPGASKRTRWFHRWTR